MADVYIDSIGGNDSSDGSNELNAIASWTRLASNHVLSPGDTVYVKRGSVFSLDVADPTKSSYIFTTSGTENAPITVTAYGEGALPEFNDYVTFSESWSDAPLETVDAGGSVYHAWNGSPAVVLFTMVQVQPGRPEGVRLAARSVSPNVDSSTLDDPNTYAFGVGKDSGSNRVYIRTDYDPATYPITALRGSTSQGPFYAFDLTNQSHIVVENIRFVGIANRTVGYPAICIRGTDSVVIRDNVFFRCRMAVSNFMGASDYGNTAFPVTNATIADNYTEDCTENGIYLLNNSTDCVIRNNHIRYNFQSDYNVGDRVDIGFQGHSTNGFVERCSVLGNVIEHSNTPHAAESQLTGDAAVSLFRASNNSVVGNTFRGLYKRVTYSSSASNTNVFSYNLIDNCVVPAGRHLVNASGNKLIATNNVFANCTFAPGSALPVAGLLSVESADNLSRFANNFFVGNTFSAGQVYYIDFRTGATPRAFTDYNYFDSSNTGGKWYRDGTTYNTLAEWQANQVSPDANSIEGAAGYRAKAYVPTAGSDLLGGGLEDPSGEGLTPVEDFYGTVVAAPPAIGIAEYKEILTGGVVEDKDSGAGTATLRVTSDTADETLYVAVRTSGAYGPTDQEVIKAGTGAVYSASATSVASDQNTFSATGLPVTGTLYCGFAQESGATE